MLRSLGLWLLAIGLVVGVWTRSAPAADVLDVATIKAGLRTVDAEENGFVERVVRLALHGDLPPSMVESTFQWARKKPRHKFQYFKKALILRAAQIGIDL